MPCYCWHSGATGRRAGGLHTQEVAGSNPPRPSELADASRIGAIGAAQATQATGMFCGDAADPVAQAAPGACSSVERLADNVACTLATPALAGAARVPSCAHFSAAAMAKLTGRAPSRCRGETPWPTVACSRADHRHPAATLISSRSRSGRRVGACSKLPEPSQLPRAPSAVTHTKDPGDRVRRQQRRRRQGPCRSPGAAVPNSARHCAKGSRISRQSPLRLRRPETRGPKVFESVGLSGTAGNCTRPR